MLQLNPTAGPQVLEYGAPSSLFERRKRGPGVTAPGLLHLTDEPRNHIANPHMEVDPSTPQHMPPPIMPQSPPTDTDKKRDGSVTITITEEGTASAAPLTGFVTGGQFRTVPIQERTATESDDEEKKNEKDVQTVSVFDGVRACSGIPPN